MRTRSSRPAPAAALLAFGLMFAAPYAVHAEDSYDSFVQAVAIDRSDQVRAMLARGMDPNTVDPNGDPVLLVAARAGWQTTLNALLGAGAKVDAPNHFGDRPITVAALGGHLAIVKILYAHGALLDAPGWTPLAYAATTGQTEVARYLVDAGANVNALSPNGTTALMMAVRGGYAPVVDLLLAHGADVNLHNENGATALSWAVRGGYDGIARALRAHGATG
jgi:ankyrin repeat protein